MEIINNTDAKLKKRWLRQILEDMKESAKN
jgi:hypothetical protein